MDYLECTTLIAYPPFEIANESDAIFVQFCKDGYDVIHNTERKVSEEALRMELDPIRMSRTTPIDDCPGTREA